MLLDFITHPILVILRSVLVTTTGLLLTALVVLLAWRMKRLPWVFMLLSCFGSADCSTKTHIVEVEQKLYDGKWLCGEMKVFKSEDAGFFTVRYNGTLPSYLTEGCEQMKDDGVVSLECKEKPLLLEVTSIVSLRCPRTDCISNLICDLQHDCENVQFNISSDLAPQFCGITLDAYMVNGEWMGDSFKVCKNETLLSKVSNYRREFTAGTEKLAGGYKWRGIERDNCFCYELNERNFLEIASRKPSEFYKVTPSENSDCKISSTFTIIDGKPWCIKNGDDFITKLMVLGAVNHGEMDLCMSKHGMIINLKDSSVNELAFRLKVDEGLIISPRIKGSTKVHFCSQFKHDKNGCVPTSCGCISPLSDRSRFSSKPQMISTTMAPKVRSRRIREAECYFWGFYCTSDDVLFTTSEEERAFIHVSEQVDQNTADIALLKGKLDFLARVVQTGFCSNGTKHFQGCVEVEIIKGLTMNVTDWCTKESFREFCEASSVSEHNLSSQVRQAIMNARNNEKQSVFTVCILLLALNLAIITMIRKLWRGADFKLRHSHILTGMQGDEVCLGYHRMKKDAYSCRCGRISLGALMTEITTKCNYRGESLAVDNNKVDVVIKGRSLKVHHMCEDILIISDDDSFEGKQSEIINALTVTDKDRGLIKALIERFPDQPYLMVLLEEVEEDAPVGLSGNNTLPGVDIIPMEMRSCDRMEEATYEALEVLMPSRPRKPPRGLARLTTAQMCDSSHNLYAPIFPESRRKT